MSMKKHIADAEAAPFQVVNVAPDFCVVDGCVVPFEIMQHLSSENSNYTETVAARKEKILTVGSVIQGVIGNAGAGVLSGVATGGGKCVVVEGDATVLAEGKPTARDGHAVLMNCS